MTNKEIIPRFKEITPGLPTKRVVPDRVVTAAEADFEAAEAVMTGYEYIDEALPPNWPPEKGIIPVIKEFLADVSFAIRYPHAYRAFRKLERAQKKES